MIIYPLIVILIKYSIIDCEQMKQYAEMQIKPTYTVTVWLLKHFPSQGTRNTQAKGIPRLIRLVLPTF